MAASPLSRAAETARAALGRLLEALPGAKRSAPSAPEPFAAIEDETASTDILLEANAAPGLQKGAGRLDLGATVAALAKNRTLLAGLALALVFLLVLAVTALVVGAPPAAAKGAAPRIDPEGEALVRRWILPPGIGLEPRVELEREGPPAYTAAEAYALGLDPASADVSGLKSRNDAELGALFGAVR